MKIKRLFIAEKPSLGRAIAKELGNEVTKSLSNKTADDGTVTKGAPSYIECGNGDVVTWCFGHMLEQAEPEQYDKKYEQWNIDDLPIAPGKDEWQLLPLTKSAEQLETIVDLVTEAEILVSAGDDDREGDLLIEEVFAHASATPEQRKTALRILISDLNPIKVQEALASMRPYHEFIPRMQSALARSRADWLLGMNLSRICTCLAKIKGYGEIMRVGRVQTPLLTLVVMRDLEILSFEPTTFFNVIGEFEKDGIPFQAKWVTEQRCLQKQAADNVIECLAQGNAQVTQCETKRAKAQPPLPFSLLTLQKLTSKKYGMSADTTLNIVQKLYEAKLVSYPRTEMTYLFTEKKAETAAVFDAIRTTPLMPEMVDWVNGADMSLTSGAWNDKKMAGQAHTAIVPLITCGQESDFLMKSNDAKKVFFEIIARYVAQFYPPAEDDNTVIELTHSTHLFRTTGKIERVAGWRTLLGHDKEEKDKDSTDQTLPALEMGSTLSCLNSSIKEGKTTPPKSYTDGTLLDAMSNIAAMVDDPAYKAKLKETAGLGTAATRAGIIKGLKENGYIEEVPSGKMTNLVSTPTGKMLALALPANVRDPVMTAMWEQQLEKIESGEYPFDTYMEKVAGQIITHIDAFKTGKYPFTLPESTATRCECQGYILRAANAKKPFWICTQCNKKYKDVNGVLGAAFSNKKKMETGMKDALKLAAQQAKAK